jgi:predicted dithiol-disulfide oxidoreductase (DUF899 family)
MFGPEYTAGCPSCSAITDGFNGFVVHLANHDVTLCAVSRAPLAKLQAFKRRMGWSFPWASSFGSDFNYDFQAAYTEEQQRSRAVEYNFRTWDVRPSLEAGSEGPIAEIAASVGTDVATYTREAPGMSAFALEDGVVYHTYSAYARAGRPLGHVPVARPRASRSQRDRLLVAPPRRVRQRVTRAEGCATDVEEERKEVAVRRA